MYRLIIELLAYIEQFESETGGRNADVRTFAGWLEAQVGASNHMDVEPDWEGKANGRSAESIINTLLVHMYRYARLYAKASIVGAPFSTPDEFIYLINLRFVGSMPKTTLIKRNIHEKSAGIQIVNRLINNGWAEQVSDTTDKRNKIISITTKGIAVLESSMDNIRKASKQVTGNLTQMEKIQLINILLKLEDFHDDAFQNDAILNSLSSAEK